MQPQNISIADFDYQLPDEAIALHPLAQRDASKLLVYKNGEIQQSTFLQIAEYIPEGTLLVFNDTKVINARLKFTKPTGAVIEVFCLEPYGVFSTYEHIMQSKKAVQWKCLVGGAAKWKDEALSISVVINEQTVVLNATKIEKITEAFIIEFSWDNNDYSFAEIIASVGSVPLPPYIKRSTVNEDTNRYQTLFAQHSGSVAAPTAGLHFSENIFKSLSQKNINKSFVTLHVGAGTFKPVKAATMAEHEMHAEYIDVSTKTIKDIITHIGKIGAVGTTSLRTIESLYWFGVKAFLNPSLNQLTLMQWDVYEPQMTSINLSASDALHALLKWMDNNRVKKIFTKTQIIIAPGYKFKIANLLVTNFHQPRSTLLLLVAAAIGNDWKKMYDVALQNEFRFLSYGDGNLIFIDQ